MDPVIREISAEEGLEDSVRVIRDSFRTVADEFGLTRENCPTHPSFITAEQLDDLRIRKVKLFGQFLDEMQIGFISIEKVDKNLYYIEKLAVLPDCRHNGYGTRLVEFALNYARNNKGKEVAIGIIDKHTVLKDWYKDIGFKEVLTREFDNLPFTVCFMRMGLNT